MTQFFKKIIVFILELEARLVLKKYKPRIIAITGSVGKTTTKDAIYAVLSHSFHVRRSEKSFNSEIGIPLTILGLPNAWSNPFEWVKNIVEGVALILLKNNYPHTLVLEVGADRPGDIKHIASWLKPDTVVLTRFPTIPVHVEYFDSPEHVIKEKLYLVHAVKDGGAIVVNLDDDKMRSVTHPEGGSMVTYGMRDGADLMASDMRFTYKGSKLTGTSFSVSYKEKKTTVEIKGALGRQHVYPVLSALALGVSHGLGLDSMVGALRDYKPPPGRMRIIEGKKLTTLIDDGYNSSPIAAEEALEVLGALRTTGRKIAVLGDMMELGSYTARAHRDIGKRVAETADILVTVGIRSHYTAEQAHKSGMKKKDIFEFDNSSDAGDALLVKIGKGDIVLVKGSQSVRMERVVEELMEHPEEKKELLVRQDREWLKKD